VDKKFHDITVSWKLEFYCYISLVKLLHTICSIYVLTFIIIIIIIKLVSFN
jgi:uncharacterized membrane protein YhaH (DUF805 family)